MNDAESVREDALAIAEAIGRRDVKTIDVAGDAALVTGIQSARVRIEGRDIDDRRAFVDWFVKESGGWKLRVAVDLPVPPEAPGADGG